jgi:S-adenosylmethionine hydrolase
MSTSANTPPPCITLLTDFGTQDSYVGILKGVIAGICPQAVVIDLTHEIPPQDIAAARFNLLMAYRYFPAHTIHLVVVDPGVGSARRAIALETPLGRFVAPDNGVLSGVLADFRPEEMAGVSLDRPEWWRTDAPSATFHGRDIFAPGAAHWATGVPLQQLGSAVAIADFTPFPLKPYTRTAAEIQGSIQYGDRFGNLITTIPGTAITHRTQSVWIGDRAIPCHRTYGDVLPGQPLALIGSHGWLEIAVNQGSAREQLNLGVGDEVWVRE